MLTRHMGVNVQLDTYDVRTFPEVFGDAEQQYDGAGVNAGVGSEVEVWEDGIVEITPDVSKGTTVQCSVPGGTKEYDGANASKSKRAAARVRAM